MSVVVLGASGQVGQHVRLLLPSAVFLSRGDADLSNPDALTQKLLALEASALVNCAAYTAVDRAESEPELAWKVNAAAPAAMASVSRSRDIPLIHISTDYVFDGTSDRPYVESDATAPLNVYGATKLAGEQAVRSIAPKHWILRTSWVFSEFGGNFVKTMLRLAGERDKLNIVADQRGRPTHAGDLAKVIVSLCRQPSLTPFGTYHVTGGPVVSWCDFAIEIFTRARALGIIARMPSVTGIPTSAYPTPAKRPLNSALRPSPMSGLDSIDWRAGLQAVLSKLQN